MSAKCVCARKANSDISASTSTSLWQSLSERRRRRRQRRCITKHITRARARLRTANSFSAHPARRHSTGGVRGVYRRTSLCESAQCARCVSCLRPPVVYARHTRNCASYMWCVVLCCVRLGDAVCVRVFVVTELDSDFIVMFASISSAIHNTVYAHICIPYIKPVSERTRRHCCMYVCACLCMRRNNKKSLSAKSFRAKRKRNECRCCGCCCCC